MPYDVLNSAGQLVTVLNIGTSNAATWDPAGDSVEFINNPVTTLITVIDIDTGSALDSARVLVLADSNGPLSYGTTIISGLTDVSGQISDVRPFTSNQPVFGRVRRSSEETYYKTGPIVGTIDNGNGLSLTIQMVKDQ